MHCYVSYCYVRVFVAIIISSETYIFNFGYLSLGHYIYVSKEVKIRGYFTKLKVVREQNRFRKHICSTFLIYHEDIWMMCLEHCTDSAHEHAHSCL